MDLARRWAATARRRLRRVADQIARPYVEDLRREIRTIAPTARPPSPGPDPAVDGGSGEHLPSAAVTSSAARALTVGEFRERFERGELSLSRWHEFSVSPDGLVDPDADPHTEAYAQRVLETWRAITGRDSYEAARDEAFTLDDADYLARPYPFASGDPAEVSRYLGAVAATVDRVGAPPPATVIELGSGWGHLALTLAATGYDVTAVDLNPASVALLRCRAAALRVPLTVVEQTFTEYEPPDGVDAVIFFESFHHCERPFELLDRCSAALAPGGRILFVSEAIYDDFYAPWGVRLDGSATFMAAQHGWLELGFRRDFFRDELEQRGLAVTWEVRPELGAYGTFLVGQKHGLQVRSTA